MSKNRTLMVISDDIENVTQIKWDKAAIMDFQLTLKTGPIISIKIISKKVIEITFKAATLIFDVTEDELKKIEWEE